MRKLKVEIFVPHRMCSCSLEPIRRKLENIKKEIEDSHGVEVEIKIHSIISERAWILGIKKSMSMTINERVVLEGKMLNRKTIEKALKEEIKKI